MPQIEFPPFTLPLEEQARILFFMGWSLSDIAKRLDRGVSTIAYWRDNKKWEEQTTYDRLRSATEIRYMHLLFKEKKSNADYKEFDRVCKTLEKLFLRNEKQEGGKRSRTPNFMKLDPEEVAQKIDAYWHEHAFPYQRNFIAQTEKFLSQRGSDGQAMVLKGRQTGFTWGLGIGRNLRRAALLGHNQIYISASKRQAYQARNDIKRVLKEIFGVDVPGTDQIELPNGAVIDFLGANASTAQGYTGDVTIDEYAWMNNFEELSEVVKACATLKQYNIVMSSTPSHEAHPAFDAWMGLTDGRKGVTFTHDEARAGILCSDGVFRKIITVEDAVNEGNTLIDVERLKLRHPDNYHQLFMAQWLKNSDSAFEARQIMRCMVDTFEEWPDFWPEAKPERPFGDKEVVIGYDPAKELDVSSCVVVALPTKEHPYHRVIEKFNLYGTDYEEQAAHIDALTRRYNVLHIGVDSTGVGAAVAARIQFPNVQKMEGSAALKSFLVMQARKFFREKHLRFPIEWSDVFESFLSIRPVAGRGQVLYETVRTSQTAHADHAWAIMYALGYINIDGKTVKDRRARGRII